MSSPDCGQGHADKTAFPCLTFSWKNLQAPCDHPRNSTCSIIVYKADMSTITIHEIQDNKKNTSIYHDYKGLFFYFEGQP